MICGQKYQNSSPSFFKNMVYSETFADAWAKRRMKVGLDTAKFKDRTIIGMNLSPRLQRTLEILQ